MEVLLYSLQYIRGMPGDNFTFKCMYHTPLALVLPDIPILC